MAGGAQAKMSTWVSTPNQSLISKVTKKRVGFKLKIFVFPLLKTVHCRAERNPGRIGRLFNCNDRGKVFFVAKSSGPLLGRLPLKASFCFFFSFKHNHIILSWHNQVNV